MQGVANNRRWKVVGRVIRSHAAGGIGLFGAALSGEDDGESIFDNLWLDIPSLVGLIGAITFDHHRALAVLKRHERSSVVILTAIVSTLVFLYVALTVALG